MYEKRSLKYPGFTYECYQETRTVYLSYFDLNNNYNALLNLISLVRL